MGRGHPGTVSGRASGRPRHRSTEPLDGIRMGIVVGDGAGASTGGAVGHCRDARIVAIDAVCMRPSAGVEALARLEAQTRDRLFGDHGAFGEVSRLGMSPMRGGSSRFSGEALLVGVEQASAQGGVAPARRVVDRRSRRYRESLLQHRRAGRGTPFTAALASTTRTARGGCAGRPTGERTVLWLRRSPASWAVSRIS
jgi:hypothetical protein